MLPSARAMRSGIGGRRRGLAGALPARWTTGVPNGTPRAARSPMMVIVSWLAWLGLAVVITGFAAVTGIKSRGTRHVARTDMMGVARVALWVAGLILAYMAYRAYSAG
jgi:hypothetical protein